MKVYKVEAIDEVQHIARFRLFADNYQFYICDPDRAIGPLQMFGAVMNVIQADQERGWVRTDSTITLFTVQDLNDHRIDVFVGKEYDGHGNAQRVFAHILNLSNGKLDIFCGTDVFTDQIQTQAGIYTIYTKVFNIGEGCEEYIENDEEFLSHDEMERYEIVLVPGKKVEKDGIIFDAELQKDKNIIP